jgi:hypothetical protein
VAVAEMTESLLLLRSLIPFSFRSRRGLQDHFPPCSAIQQTSFKDIDHVNAKEDLFEDIFFHTPTFAASHGRMDKFAATHLSFLAQQNSATATTTANASPHRRTTKMPPMLTTPSAEAIAISFRDFFSSPQGCGLSPPSA